MGIEFPNELSAVRVAQLDRDVLGTDPLVKEPRGAEVPERVPFDPDPAFGSGFFPKLLEGLDRPRERLEIVPVEIPSPELLLNVPDRFGDRDHARTRPGFAA